MANSKNIFVPLRAAGVFISLLATPSAADQALYDSPPPADAVFVRWLEPQGQSTGTEIWGHPISDDIGTGYAAISARLLRQGEPGGYYSVIAQKDGVAQVISEPARSDRSKVHLFLVSCGGDAVELVVPGPAGSDTVTSVIGPLTSQGAAARAVNPVATPLAVVQRGGESGEQSEIARFEVVLTRGQNLTFYACDGQARMIENQMSGHVAG